MPLASWIGSAGVALLLAAFLGNLLRLLETRSYVYITLNLLGAALACWASVLLRFWPFVVLEGTWALVALAALIQRMRQPTAGRHGSSPGSDRAH